MSLYEPRPKFNDISFLSTHFQLRHVQILKDLGGTYNLNLLVSTERGEYVLRLYRPWVTRERLYQLQHIKHILSHAGFPVLLPIPGSAGDTILEYNNGLMELEPFIVHDSIADTWERNVKAFTLLGKLHSFLATQTGHIEQANPVVSNYGTPEQLLTWTQQAREKIVQSSQHRHTPERQQALTLYEESIHMLSSLQTWWKAAQEHLPRQLTHGDYGGGNILFLQEHIVALLDFDLLRVRERVYELAYSLYWCLWKWEKLTDITFWPRVKELLDAYSQATQHPISLIEIQSIPIMMVCVPLYWIAETLFLPDPMHEVIKQAQKVADACWLLEHSEELADLFT